MALPRYRTILVPVDFSPSSRKALNHGVALAKGLGATLDVIHVTKNLKPSIPFSAANRKVVARLQKEAQEQDKQELARWVKRLPANLNVRSGVVRGLGHEAILARARRIKADLIVMGARGQNLAESLLLGSTADRVVRKATCPVVLLPPKR